MGLRLKFNIVLLAVFACGFAATSLVARRLLQDNARSAVLREARLMLEAATAVRGYTVDHVGPHLAAQMAEVFLPQSVPAFAATETINRLKQRHPDYTYKEATLNPTNPRNRTADWEADLVQRFRQVPGLPELIGDRQSATGRSLYIARPIMVGSPACLRCHGLPTAAPTSMLRIYGESNGFGWKAGEVVGAQVVTVPMELPLAQARATFVVFAGSLGAVFGALALALNLLLGWLILRPVRRLTEGADRLSTGDFTEPEFDERGRDEVARLGTSFNRMRRSLERAMQMIARDTRP